MAGSPSTLGTLFRYELKMLLRDKRTILFSVVLPLVVLPGMFLIMSFTERRAEERRESRTYEYAVVGSRADLARELIAEARTLELDDPARTDDPDQADRPDQADVPDQPNVPDQANVPDQPGGAASGEPQADGPAAGEERGGGALVEARPADPDSALEAGEIHFIVEALSPAEALALHDSIAAAEAAEAEEAGDGAEAGESAGALEGERERGMTAEEVAAGVVTNLAETSRPAVPLFRIRFRGNSDESEAGASRMRRALESLREHRRNQAYVEAGLPVDPTRVAAVELDEAATAERESGAQLALWLTPLIIMLMLSGGSIVAADSISGEKERGTLETLLTTSARRREIVNAKQLLIIVVGLAITVINVANLALYLGLGLFDLPENFVVSVEPLSLLVLLLLFLPLTVLISSVLLMLSGYSKGYKEYQIYFFPVLVVFVVPSAAAVLPGLELASVISVVPLVNISVAVREVLVGEYNWLFLAITFTTTVALAAWLARLTERTLSTEKLITAAEMDEADLRGGPALFPKRVLRWFGVIWVIFFLSTLWFGAELGLRGQVAYNLLGLFLGGSLLMIRRYRLDPRKALALRMPRPAVWGGVLLGAPSAFIVGIGVAQLGQYIFPIPERLIEAFGQFLLPEGMPLWQILLFLAVLPGICEEIAFRGVLLHGLRRRFRPVVLALVVGAIFGFFHVELFRLIPTTYLGILLAAVTLLTGSIFPAMLWHALNNAVALVPTHLGWWTEDFQFPLWIYPAAALGLALALYIIWRNRTPYPGLRADKATARATGGATARADATASADATAER